jgi:hypothetical protein
MIQTQVRHMKIKVLAVTLADRLIVNQLNIIQILAEFNFKEIVGVTNVIQIKNENELVC